MPRLTNLLKIFFFICLPLILIQCKNIKEPIDVPNLTNQSIYEGFISAFNSHDSTILKSKILEIWSDTLIGENKQWLETDMNYWLTAYKEFGPLELKSVGEDQYNDYDVAWCQGSLSGDWVGVQFDLTDDLKVDGTNILRSCLPTKWNVENSLSRPDQIDLESYFNRLDHDFFSGSVLIAKGDSILYQGAHGFADKKANTPMNENHQLVIASTTKMFTATAIAQLVEAGKLELDTPISNYLNDFPKSVGDQITTAHLLTHTSGIELDEIDEFNAEIVKARNVEACYQINLKYLPQLENFNNFKPLESLNYSNENFDILAKLIEVISNQDFYEYLSEHIFDPMGMSQTGPIDMETENPNLAHNYQLEPTRNGAFDEGYRREVANSNLSFSRAAGSFQSTPKDLYAFMKGIQSGELMSTKMKSRFLKKQVDNLNIPIYRSWYGYGFYINERYGNQNYGHAGGIPGGSSRCEYYPEYDVYVIITSNYNGAANSTANYLSSLIPFLGKE